MTLCTFPGLSYFLRRFRDSIHFVPCSSNNVYTSSWRTVTTNLRRDRIPNQTILIAFEFWRGGATDERYEGISDGEGIVESLGSEANAETMKGKVRISSVGIFKSTDNT